MHELIRLADARPRRRYRRLTPSIAATVIRLRAAKRSYREIAETVNVSRGAVGAVLTRPATVGVVMDLARRNGYDRAAIRERGTDLLLTRLGTMIDDVMDLVEAKIQAGDAKGFLHAAQGIERLQRVLDRAAGRARVATAPAPKLEADVLIRQILDRSSASPALPKVS